MTGPTTLPAEPAGTETPFGLLLSPVSARCPWADTGTILDSREPVTAASTAASQDTRTFGDRYFLWIALLPAALVLILVGVVPLLYAGWLSLHEYNLVRPPQLFIGLENYAELLADDRFQYSMVFTFAFAFAATTIEVVLGFLIAWLLADKQIPDRLSSVSRTLMLIPYMVAPVVMAYIFKTLIYDANFGYLSDVLQTAGGGPFIMFEGTWKPILALLFMDVILRMPFVVLILYAGISTLSPEQLEAAAVDGASLRQRITSIVLPVLRPIILIAFVFRFMDALKIFDRDLGHHRRRPRTDHRERLGVRIQDRFRAVQDGLCHRLVAGLRGGGGGPHRHHPARHQVLGRAMTTHVHALAGSTAQARCQDHHTAGHRLRHARAVPAGGHDLAEDEGRQRRAAAQVALHADVRELRRSARQRGVLPGRL